MQWPRRFVYVCNATQASVVNLLPLVHAGLEKVSEIFIFCGAPNADVEDDRLRREAIDPALRLQTSIKEIASQSLNSPKVHIRYGNGDNFSDWANQMSLICFDARQTNTPIIYNVTGGRKPMSIGGIHGGKSQPMLLNVGGSPLRVEFLVEEKQIQADRASEISFDQYLLAYGLFEQKREFRLNRERQYTSDSSIIEAFANNILSKDVSVFEALNVSTRGLVDKKGKFLGRREISFADPQFRLPAAPIKALKSAMSELAELNGFKLKLDSEGNSVGFIVSNSYVATLLRGGWLEAAIFNRLRHITRGRNNTAVIANVKLAFDSALAINTVAEIDVALMIGSQLHLVEAKTVGFFGHEARAGNEKSLAQTESIKRLLLGQFGNSFVVNPRETEVELTQKGNFTRRAREGGIHLYLGPNALDELDREFKSLIEQI